METDDPSLEDRIDTLESVLESQRETIERQADRLEAQRAKLEQLDGDTPDEVCDKPAGGPSVSRRSALTGIGLAGLVGLGVTSASASQVESQGQLGTEDRPLDELYTTSITGVSETDSNVFELAVQDADDPSEAGNIVAGHPNNSVGDVSGATISGGGGDFGSDDGNEVTGIYGTVGGGLTNKVHGNSATISGGGDNTAEGEFATVAGGADNAAGTDYASIGGGENNATNNHHATVGGGQENVADELWSTVGGGVQNNASQPFSTISGGADNATMTSNMPGIPMYGTIGGGHRNEVNSRFATIPGGDEAKADMHGQFAYASGSFETAGDAQASTYVLRNETSASNQQVELFLDGEEERIEVPVDCSIAFTAQILGRTLFHEGASWHIDGSVTNDGTMSTIHTRIVSEFEDEELGSVDIGFDDSNDSLEVSITSGVDNSRDTRWVATIRTTKTEFSNGGP
ncbi:hypothetical protein [Natronosalvus amylolyticus]|uniref:hypothetical protein n=1 Tax=Natronosalvus amylolyticus TaxID=2961994 RepID=UPI0020CA1A2F|nr:hypothetical protein [Natronosalvus amylolyticus]